VARIHQLENSEATAPNGATAKDAYRKAAPASEADRRTDRGGLVGPVTLARPAIGKVYPPAAATLFLALEAATVVAIGHALAGHFGVGASPVEFGPRLLLLGMSAILFAVAAILQGTFVTRPPSIVAMWGMRLVAPLAIAQLVAIAAFAAFFPNLPLAPTQPILRWIGAWFIMSYFIGVLNTTFEAAIRYSERVGTLARRVVVFGGGGHGQRFIEALMLDPDSGLRVDAFFDDRTNSIPDRIGGVPFAGTAEDLILFTRANPVDEIVIALPWSADKRILDILRKFRALPVPIRLAPDSTLLFASLAGSAGGDTVPAPVIQRQPLSPWGLFLKDLTDRMLAGVALLLLGPLLIAIAVAVKLTSPGPVFFRQPRLGFNNQPFRVFKFRTMRTDCPAGADLKQATRHDPRVTPVGAFLRRWSLDELPQILNVLQGDMSLVGPRPHPIWRQASDLWGESGNEPLEAIIHEYAARHRVKPGITGWAQVSGFRGETATVERMRQRIEYDIDYIDHWSLWFDFKIMFLTLIAVLKTSDVY
jgi:polysaccharide biosynthesis protein PslA